MFRTSLAIALGLSACLAQAADLTVPPIVTPSTKAATILPPVANPAADRPALDTGLVPTEQDMARARKAREATKAAKENVTTYVSKRGTRIEEHHDQNNRLTEVRVTPGSTEIPYTMENRSDRPINNTPGADSRSTLGTPQFFKHTW
ncbi:MAG: hypothetical protein J6S08_08235 [Duodenibacillus sp.]|nr:hypothetical protein [Duodenibacillus sp.]